MKRKIKKETAAKQKKLDLLKYFSSKPLPSGFFLNPEAFPKKPVSLKSLGKQFIVIDCSLATRLDCKPETYLRKIRKIEKLFGVRNTGGGCFVGEAADGIYNNDFMFTEEKLAELQKKEQS